MMSEQAHGSRNRTARGIVIDLAIMVVIGVVLALIGPFGSFELPLALRLMNWVGFALIGYLIYAPMSLVVEWGSRKLDLPEWGVWIAAVLVATVPMTAVVWSMGFLGRAFQWPSAEEALTSYFYVLVIGGGISALFYAIGARKGDPASHVQGAEALSSNAGVTAPPLPEPAFIERLPSALGSDLIALEMEDHYVRAHTALGSEMVLMRLRDAVAELGDLEGMQVHRSWWVARGAVEDVRREGRNIRLVLARGIEAPVSRANVSALKDAGWI
ncbi:MAG: LytTR family DNA-binding domain-containing protein [Erythrobacter sp.]